MIYTLRKRHFSAWIIISVFLIIAFAWTLIHQTPEAETSDFKPLIAAQFSEVYKKGGDENFQLTLRRDGNLPGRQLEIVYSKPVPGAGIAVHYYTAVMSNSKGMLLGQLQEPGISRFNLPRTVWDQPNATVILFDLTKGNEISRYSLR